MEFFDKKQEVLEVKLTPYGKYKLSQGRFKPTYYSFFDEGVLYDSRWSGEGVISADDLQAGFIEKQNEIEPRIQDKTAMLKTLTVYSGIQTNQGARSAVIQQRLENADTSLMGDPLYGNPGDIYAAEELQPVASRPEFLSRPLGKSKISLDKQPSWAVEAYAQELSSSATAWTRSYVPSSSPPLEAASAISAIDPTGFSATLTSATAVDAIDTTGLAAETDDCSISFAIPTANGGQYNPGGTATPTTITLDVGATVAPAPVANTIGIGVRNSTNAEIAGLIIKAINNETDAKIAVASSGVGKNYGVRGITAAEGSSDTQITLTMDGPGTSGNITSAIASTDGLDIVDEEDFTGGAGADCSFAITIPEANGGDTEGGAGAITILLDIDERTGPTGAADQITIGVKAAACDPNTDPDCDPTGLLNVASLRLLIKDAINGASSPRITYATSGRGQTGVLGISAVLTPSPPLTLVMDTVGAVGNITSAIANVSGFAIVDVTDFTGGTVPDTYQEIKLIPQIDISCKYNTYIKNVGDGWSSYVEGNVIYENPAVAKDSIFTTPTQTNTLQAITTALMDDIYIGVEHKALVLGIGEENTDFNRENFEIEVFLSGADYGTAENGYLKQLRFHKNPDEFYDLDDVGYYLTINSDEEINPALLQQLGIRPTGLADPETGAISTRQFFIKDLYGPADDLCPPEETE